MVTNRKGALSYAWHKRPCAPSVKRGLNLDFLTRPSPNIRYKVKGFHYREGLKRCPHVFLSLKSQFNDMYSVRKGKAFGAR